jgi:hypothetical protein
MSEKPPFDTVRAAFFLVAGVIATYCVLCIAAMVHCWVNYELVAKLSEGGCDMRGRFFDLLSAALSAALAFAGGFSRKP